MATTAIGRLSSSVDRIATQNQDVLLLIFRIVAAWLFLVYGWDKINNLGGFQGYLTALGFSSMVPFWAYVGALIELVGAILLIVGFQTRLAAAFLALYVIVATVIAHRYWSYPPEMMGAQASHFYKNTAIIGGLLVLFVAGPGRYSVDGSMSRK
jgi:putative oxidoreductase